MLLLESFYGGSHKAVADGIVANSCHEVGLTTMPSRFWKWRMRGASLWFANTVRAAANDCDLFLCTSLMDIAALRSLVPSCPPVLYYCHESQISYPQPNANPGDLHFAFTDLVNMLSSALVVFNSRSHRSTYLDRLPQFLNSLPEFRPMWAVEEIANRSTVCYPGIDIAGPADASPAADNSGGRHRPPLVIWNHRWEFDKNPAVFFRALDEVADRGVQFEVAILGENFKTVPEEFTRARARLGKRVIHYGYAADRDVYRDWLARGTVVVSSAIQENFGISVLEAIAHGCAPVLPRRLSYPELIPSEFHDDTFYDTDAGLADLLEKKLRPGPSGRPPSPAEGLVAHARGFAWPDRIRRFDSLMASVGKSGDG